MFQPSVFRQMAERWPSTVLSRDQVDKFTGGLLSPRYLANLDSKGLGPARIIKVGRKAGYVVSDFVEWLEDRAAEEIAKRPKALRNETR